MRSEDGGPNILQSDRWQPWQSGFTVDSDGFVCDNGSDANIQRGASQTVVLEQTRPEPIVAVASSRAEGIGGSPDNNYALYLDLAYMDGTNLWGQAVPFDVGTHTWQTRRVTVVPEKPVRTVSMHLLLRGHAGKAWFRDPSLQVLNTPAGATRFDGVPVVPVLPAAAGFQVRDVAADSDFVRIESAALDLQLHIDATARPDADGEFFDVTLTDTSGRDRAVSLVYSVPVPAQNAQWLVDPRRAEAVTSGREYLSTTPFSGVGSNGRLSWYPLGEVSRPEQGVALGIDMQAPAFFRIGFHADLGEFYLAYDLGLTPEHPAAHLRFCRYTFDPANRFRGAWIATTRTIPRHFAAARLGKACGCPSPRSVRWRAGRISASNSRKGTTRRLGTMSTV